MVKYSFQSGQGDAANKGNSRNWETEREMESKQKV